MLATLGMLEWHFPEFGDLGHTFPELKLGAHFTLTPQKVHLDISITCSIPLTKEMTPLLRYTVKKWH